MAGLFISFEGGDAVGKTTQIDRLAQWLHETAGLEVVTTREPGGTSLGRQLRELVLHGEDMEPRAEALLYAADRAHHVASLVRPALERGAAVITDRYLDSSVAYQGEGRGLTSDAVEKLNLWATGDLLPHVTYLLDLDPAIAQRRLGRDLDRLERAGLDFHQRTRTAYLERAAADPGRIVVLDASESIDAIADQVSADLASRLPSLVHLGDSEAEGPDPEVERP